MSSKSILAGVVVLIILSGICYAPVFQDSFTTSHDYVTSGVAGTGWDGFVGLQEGETVTALNANISRSSQLYIESTLSYWAEPWNPLGPFLYKMFWGDFTATVQVTDYAGTSSSWVRHNDCGLMARASRNPDQAGNGEDWVCIHYFPIWNCGNFVRQANDNLRQEVCTNGLGFNAPKYLRLERAGNVFRFKVSSDGTSWTEMNCSPITRNDFDSLPLQVGIQQAVYSNEVGYVAFDNFAATYSPWPKTRNPVPADGAIDVSANITLRWTPGDLVQPVNGHEVYLGKDQTSVTNATRTSRAGVSYFIVSDPCCMPGTLNVRQKYYWRVDEVNSTNTWKGDIWSFTTQDEKATEPYPADNDAGIEQSLLMYWTAGPTALSHDVYIGPNFNDVNDARRPFADVTGDGKVNAADLQVLAQQWLSDPFGLIPYADINHSRFVDLFDEAMMAMEWMEQAPDVFMGNQDSKSFPISGLQIGTTYYWRIDEVNDFDVNSPWKGNIWNFTVSDPDSILIEPETITGVIDEKVYGHFLEHIYHSVNGGLWGELVWNRSFEEFSSTSGNWSIEGDELVQSSMNTDVRLTFGDTSWTDYEYTLEAMKTGGNEGFLIMFRVLDNNRFYWANLGGWENTRHQIEKSRNPVGPSYTGSIATSHWYTIRIRCEGGHYQVWLDGIKIIDWTDTNSPHLSGRVGVGTWATTARFRNINVSTLTGTILFSGLPDITVETGKYWSSYGNGTLNISSTNPLNNNYCQKIIATGTETGIQQTPFFIENAKTYHGSLWVRGDAPSGLVVRLKNGSTTIQEQNIAAPTASWAEYPFTLISNQAAENATLQMGVKGTGTVWIDQVSMMSETAEATGGYRPDLLTAVDELKTPIIRWPGGCFASAYFWKDGIGPQHQRIKYPIILWDDQDINSYGTDEFIRMCQSIGVEPLIVINTGILSNTCGVNIPNKKTASQYLQDAADWVEYCNGPATSTWGAVRAANGHPEPYNVKYWEIDNETWGAGSVAYSNKVLQFVPAMKAVDPNIKIIVCGGYGYDVGWNQTVLNMCANVMDYLSIHYYENADLYDQGPITYENYLHQLDDMIKASANLNIKVFLSEWNAQSTDWRTGLYAGGLLNVFERCGEFFEIGSPALFLRHVTATGWDNAFINFDHRKWFPAPNYAVMKLWRDHFAPYKVGIAGNISPLNAVATVSEDGSTIYFKAVNAKNYSVPVKLFIKGGFQNGGATMKIIAPNSLSARNTLDNPHNVWPTNGTIQQDGIRITFTMPRWSTVVVTIPK